ncbi:hypothetical protein [Rhizobium sp. WYJ-E13]|uniref:hypothetical protein n=1 Tax=Rhizobium sp. WYJ-E13 TaxID=2849093 RepID=UPI001C1EA2B5|nr:hypothetical protein [Rhizobium sp. WYJ-E13]QWW70521.1 hypothetical protein KQ933_27290 [Rhizobium sp. WYJ-E13]
MSDDNRKEDEKAKKSSPLGRSVRGSEGVSGLPLKEGLAPARIGRKIVGQGKRREALRKWKKDKD